MGSDYDNKHIKYLVEQFSDGSQIYYKETNQLTKEIKYWMNGKYYENINSDDEWIVFNIIT